ncbi:AEC family transporter [Salibacterium aidingense]|uniref:AEC family transporter n=1 Tax=Salibacterium aidingense TaxID=384933 RepID=UPI003BC416E8
MDTLIHLVIPIFAIMFCGFLAGRFSFIPTGGAGALNGYIYYFALPALLFLSLAEASREEITSFSFFAVTAVTCVLVMGAAVVIFRLVFKKSLPAAFMYGMASSYGNTGFLGIPLAVMAFGPEAAVPAAIVTLTSDLLIISIVVVSMEYTSPSHASIFSSLTKAVLRNPINLSLLLGSLAAFLQLPVPETLKVFADTLGGAAGPTALFAIGLGLVCESRESHALPGSKKAYLSVIGLKLVVMPLTALILVPFFLEDRKLWADTFILLSAMPTGAVVNVFADKYHLLKREVPDIVVTTTLISIVTIMGMLILLD